MTERIAMAGQAAPVVMAPEAVTVITDRIRSEARGLLGTQQAHVVIGYTRGWSERVATPCFVTRESEVDRLLFNEHCSHNLAKYLVGPGGYLTSRVKPQAPEARVALVAIPATLRTVAGLIQEHQFRREDLIILGLTDGTPAGVQPDVVVGHVATDTEAHGRVLAQIRQLEHMSSAERAEWWDRQFAKCIRCYACRQVCPFCYCEQCIADQNQPQWIEKSSTVWNNRMWNTIRAFHLVGRCTSCGECDRVCPVDIPLSLLNVRMVEEIKEAFGYEAGMDTDVPPALYSFKVDDPGDFVR